MEFTLPEEFGDKELISIIVIIVSGILTFKGTLTQDMFLAIVGTIATLYGGAKGVSSLRKYTRGGDS